MKKRKILFLFPLFGLLLTGCDFKEVMANAKNWLSDNIYQPIKNLIDGGSGEKEKEDEKPHEGGEEGGGQTTEKTLQSIELSGDLAKKEYYVGDPFEASGLVVTASYSDQSTEDVTSASTFAFAPAVAALEQAEVSVTASYQEKVATKTISGLQVSEKEVPPVQENQFAEAYAAAMASSAETEKFYIEGVVVAVRGDDAFIQHESYGFTHHKTGHGLEAGDKIKAVSTFVQYYGIPQLKTIESLEKIGTAELPAELVISSAEALEAANYSVLAKVTGKAKADWSDFDPTKDKTVVLDVEGSDVSVFFKKNFFNALADQISAVKEGDTVEVSNAIISSYSKKKQLNATSSSTLVVTPKPVEVKHVESVSILEKEAGLALVEGLTGELTVKVLPEDADNKSVVWSSDDESVAKVSQTGVVTAVAEGNTTIRVESVDNSEAKDSCAVTVSKAQKVYVSSIVADPSSINLETGDDPVAITITVEPQNIQEEISWDITEGKDVIELNEHSVKPLKAGSAKIRIEGAESHVGTTVSVSVTEPQVGPKVVEYTFENTKSTTAVSDPSEISEWLKTESEDGVLVGATSSTFVYPGAEEGGSDSNKWVLNNALKIGKASEGGEVIFELSQGSIIKKATLEGYGWKDNLIVAVDYQSSAQGAFTVVSKDLIDAGTVSSIEYDFELLPVEVLRIKTTNSALLLKKLTLELESNQLNKISFNSNGEGASNMPLSVCAKKAQQVNLSTFETPKREGFEFKGWSLTANGEVISSLEMGESNVELFAIWEEKAGTNYVECELQEGQLLITTTYTDSGSVTYYLPTDTTSTAPKAISYSDVKSIPTNALWTVTKDGDNWIFTNADGDYLYANSANNGIRVGNSSNNKWTYTAKGALKNVATNRFLGVYNAQDWRSYNSSDAENYKGSAEALQFYKVA